MNSKSKDVLMEMAVGGLVFLVLFILAAFTIILSRESIFRRTYPMAVTFSNVMGLREGDNVFARGMIVGKIKTIRFSETNIALHANLTHPLRFRADYKISILPTSVLGGRYLSVNEGTDGQPVLPEDTVLRGDPPTDLITEATKTIREINQALTGGGVLTNLESMLRHLNDVAASLSAGKGTLGKLINDEVLYDDLKVIVSDIGQGKGTLGKLIKDDAVYTNLNAVALDLRQISGRLARGEGTLGKLLADDSLYTNITALALDFRIVGDRLANGEGTLGKLSKDVALYDKIYDLINMGQATLDDIRETAPITSFSSIFFGAF